MNVFLESIAIATIPRLANKPRVPDDARELVTYEFARWIEWGQSLGLLLAAAFVAAGMILLVVLNYLREGRHLPRVAAGLLGMLRVLAILGAFLFFMKLQRRVDRQVVTESRAVILVDTSQSMAVRDAIDPASGDVIARFEATSSALAETGWINSLRRTHDISLAVFDRDCRDLVQWKRRQAQLQPSTEEQSPIAPQSKHGTKDSKDSLDDSRHQPDVNGAKPGANARDENSDWVDRMIPLGMETRLGDAMKKVLDKSGGGPLAAVILISDGATNGGADPMTACETASEIQVPVFTVGVGSTQSRRNLRVKELKVPSRVFPEDRMTICALIQGNGYRDRTVDVELHVAQDDSRQGAFQKAGRQQVTFDAGTQVLPIEFTFEPTEPGRLRIEVRLITPADDQVPEDDQRATEVSVVETNTRMLLLAGGATRDYRFLRNQLRRDPHTEVNVCLQEAQEGISQDAHQILAHFPQSKETLYPYDCIVAFDPDWTLLDARQVDLLESWVAEEAGGLVVVAGPIHTSTWTQRPEQATIRALYPVVFQRRLTLLDDGQYGSKVPWPIAFTQAGLDVDYLKLEETHEASQVTWSQFPGVYGCYAVKGPKPGAQVLARYSDPEAGLSADPPVYLAEHFYGAGRVFYLGSGELWRLRRLDPGYFEVLTTQLIRHVSQGRLLRGSSRGSLMVERDRFTIGETVVLRARLTSADRKPLLTDRVICHVAMPGGDNRTVPLRADPQREGNYFGQFTLLRQGTYRIELPIPDASGEQLVRRIEAVAPNLEFNKTARNGPLLAAIAGRTGGKYYNSPAAAIQGTDQLQSLARLIDSRAEVQTIRGAPDPDFTRWLNQILLAVLCGCLCLEWLLRRLLKLA